MDKIRRFANENEEQYMWRLCQAKDNGLLDLDWDGIADVMNREFRADESEYRTEAAYRKPYQNAKRFYDAGVFTQANENSEIKQLRAATNELKKEKQKIADERAALNQALRDEARIETDMEYLARLISASSSVKLIPHEAPYINSENDLIIPVADLHMGLAVDNTFGRYDTSIAAERMAEYFTHIRAVAKLHNCQNAYVVLLGDMVSGEIHITTQLENREALSEQIEKAGELLAEFIHKLSGIFVNIYVNSVVGNHSRPQSGEVLRWNKMDDIIPWYLKAALKHIDNIEFVDGNNYDPTIGRIDVRGHEYVIVHGDYDEFSKTGVSKLVMMIGHKPSGIIMGHMHHNSFDDVNDIKMVRCGSFVGNGDDYCVTKRLNGTASQMLIVANKNGIESLCPITFTAGAKCGG